MPSNGETGRPFNIGILLYDQVEELDFCGPYETFKSAAHARRQRERTPEWQVFTVAEESGLLSTSGDLRIQPHYTFENHPPIDLLLVPGGAANRQLERPVVLEWLRRVTPTAQLNTSVCTGAFLLGAVGLLDGHSATTHISALDNLAQRFPTVTVRRDVRWVDEGPIVTAAGVSAGIDMSLHLLERLDSRELAEDIAAYMEYRWNEQ
jgi:transcriptional regulator GlxA family with amidase domain